MSTILSRQFIAVDCQQNTLFISDLPQLICDYGIVRFLDTFGFEHGPLHRYTEYVGERWVMGVSGIPVTRNLAQVRVTSEKQYIITDNQGRAYCPHYLLSEFERAFSKQAKALYRKLERRAWFRMQTGSQRERKHWRHYFVTGRHDRRTKKTLVRSRCISGSG